MAKAKARNDKTPRSKRVNFAEIRIAVPAPWPKLLIVSAVSTAEIAIAQLACHSILGTRRSPFSQAFPGFMKTAHVFSDSVSP